MFFMSQDPRADTDMTADLPNDLLAFLGSCRQLEYDAENSDIGRIKLKRDTDLSLTTITTFPGCQSIIDDPYSDLDGLYQSDVYDLVAASEDYDTEGLLCWIVALKRFGCIDPEHGDVITFPDVTWTNLAANPLPYLDAQWGDDDAVVRVLPWIHFPFRLNDHEVTLQPYPELCQVHGQKITTVTSPTRTLKDLLRQRELDDWISNCQASFPYRGVPVNAREVKYCPNCRDAEDDWMGGIEVVPPEAAPNPHGWIKCPGCGMRFHKNDTQNFQLGVHVECGQRIQVVE